MSNVPLWFDRKFEFTFPLEQYPNVCIRLRGAPARLEEMVRGISRDRLVRRPAADKWSPQEHGGHLFDLEELWASRVADFLTPGDTLTKADLTNRRTHEANHNAKKIDAIAADFRQARMSLVDRLDRLNQDHFGGSKRHPRLQQPMRLVDHLFFVAEHDDHHLARIWELIRG